MKKIYQKGFVILLALLAVSLLTVGCGQSNDPGTGSDNQDKTYTLQIGMVSPSNHPYSIVSKELADAVKEKSDGRLVIEVYDSGQLGGERELIEQVQLGTLDMTLVTIAPVSNFVDDFAVFDMPFIFVSREHAYRVLDGPIGQEMMAKLNDVNITGLAYWENGFRQIYNSKQPIHGPEDLRGLKMRVMENEIHMQTFRALGADPTPIAWPETYTALQQGVVDGFETTIGIFETSNMYEVQNHASLANLFYAGAILMINTDVYNSLPNDLQEILAELGLEYGNKQRQMVADLDETQLGLFAGHGVEVVYDLDVVPFQKAVEGVYKSFEDRFGQYYEGIQAATP